jgi:hypothetical protein
VRERISRSRAGFLLHGLLEVCSPNLARTRAV